MLPNHSRMMSELWEGIPIWFKALWLGAAGASLTIVALAIVVLVKVIIYFS